MSLTPEQVAARSGLEVAIDEMMRTHGMEEGHIPGDFVVVAAENWFDDDGDIDTAYHLYYRNGSMPSHSAIGLLRRGDDIISGPDFVQD